MYYSTIAEHLGMSQGKRGREGEGGGGGISSETHLPTLGVVGSGMVQDYAQLHNQS